MSELVRLKAGRIAAQIIHNDLDDQYRRTMDDPLPTWVRTPTSAALNLNPLSTKGGASQ